MRSFTSATLIRIAPLLLVLLILAAIIPMPGCFLDRAGTGIPIADSFELIASVGPTLVCQNDPVNVRWQVQTTYDPYEECTDGADCTYPLGVNVENAPAPNLFAGDPVDGSEIDGSRTINPTSSTSVTIRGTRTTPGGAESEQTQNFPIDVIGPDVVDFRKPLTGIGACIETGAGRSPGWQPLNIDREALLGENVVVTEICNLEPYSELRVLIRWDSGPDDEFVLGRGECRTVLTGILPDRRVQRIITTVMDPAALFGTQCPVGDPGEVMGEDPEPDILPRDYRIELGVSCFLADG